MRWTIALIAAVAIVIVVAAVVWRSAGGRGASETASYCADLAELIAVIDPDAPVLEWETVEEYNALLAKVVEHSPPGHGEAWALMLKLSDEPFTYENFNPALDALDRIDVYGTCRRLPRFHVGNAGRIQRLAR